ncbi:MAG TPA: prolyl oligopeptidase family serine peptidase [Candidatus Limnocylindrales bacterium]
MATLTYPAPPTTDQVDDYHGTPIRDPYRLLEDSDRPASRAWIQAENALTEQVLATAPGRAAIRDRLAELWQVPRAGAPWRRGDRWFQLRNDGTQNQDVLWALEGGPDGPGHVLLDPNRLNEEGTTTLAAVATSRSGRIAACALSDAGSDWLTWTAWDVETGDERPDRVPWAKFSSAAWTHDETGFFYGRYEAPSAAARPTAARPTAAGPAAAGPAAAAPAAPASRSADADLDAYEAPNRNMELRYHRLGTNADDDPIVFATPDQPEWGFEPEVSADGELLVLVIWRGTDPENRIYVGDLPGGVEGLAVRPLIDVPDAAYLPIGSIGRTLYLRTDKDAPLGRVVAIDVDDPSSIREVIPEGDEAIERVMLVGNRLAVDRLRDAHHRLAIHELDGRKVTDVALPSLVSIQEMAGEREDEELFVVVDAFAAPRTVLGVRMRDGAVREIGRRELAWDPTDFVTEQVFVASADGSRIPLFLSRRRDVEPTGDVPTVLYGYGGFQIAIGPIFKPEWLTWMERGGLLAVASLRGGSEYGKRWHDAGRLEHKQNVFDDFAACARWLASSGWTTADRIGILGRSNGGLLVGASITQHPELFGAAVAEVGVMDMLRFHKFTIGWGWTSDYGSADDPEQFKTLLRYSPLHNCRTAPYPPTLITTGDHDDRVVPGHSLKFAATLQAAQTGPAPILLRTDMDAGHGAGKPISKLVEERADVLAFLELALRH